MKIELRRLSIDEAKDCIWIVERERKVGRRGRTWKKREKKCEKIQTNEEKAKQTNFDQSPKGLENSENISKNMKRILKETKNMETADHGLSIKNRGGMVLVKFNSIWKYLFFRKESKKPEK